jgi:hypothetical protein
LSWVRGGFIFFIETKPVQLISMKTFGGNIKRYGDYFIRHLRFLEICKKNQTRGLPLVTPFLKKVKK